jgi:hypothetical protein
VLRRRSTVFGFTNASDVRNYGRRHVGDSRICSTYLHEHHGFISNCPAHCSCTGDTNARAASPVTSDGRYLHVSSASSNPCRSNTTYLHGTVWSWLPSHDIINPGVKNPISADMRVHLEKESDETSHCRFTKSSLADAFVITPWDQTSASACMTPKTGSINAMAIRQDKGLVDTTPLR